jgi:hypothetical protein
MPHLCLVSRLESFRFFLLSPVTCDSFVTCLSPRSVRLFIHCISLSNTSTVVLFSSNHLLSSLSSFPSVVDTSFSSSSVVVISYVVLLRVLLVLIAVHSTLLSRRRASSFLQWQVWVSSQHNLVMEVKCLTCCTTPGGDRKFFFSFTCLFSEQNVSLLLLSSYHSVAPLLPLKTPKRYIVLLLDSWPE